LSAGQPSARLWPCRRLKELLCAPLAYGVLKPDRYSGPDGVPIIRIQDVAGGQVLTDSLEIISPALSHAYRRTLIRTGELVISVVGTLGRCFRVPPALEGCNLSRALARVQLLPAADCRYIQHWVNSAHFAEQVALVAQGAAQKVLNLSDLRELNVPLPPLDTQRTVAAALDRTTGQIDTLIAKKERLVAVLEEKRRALITKAVTKGLDSNDSMKESGVAWMGAIPSHWEVVRMKHVARLGSGHTPSRQHPEYWVPEECTIPWISLADVGKLRRSGQEYIEDSAERISSLGLAHSAARLLPPETVILSRTASVGFSAMMRQAMATTQDFVSWVCGPRLRPAFLLHVLRAMASEYDRLVMGSVHRTIYMPDVARFVTPLPPIQEQDRIVALIRARVAPIDEATQRLSLQVDKLREYRRTLITAAVTGAIDPDASDATGPAREADESCCELKGPAREADAFS
jgi:type I restriction enzyme S subunit